MGSTICFQNCKSMNYTTLINGLCRVCRMWLVFAGCSGVQWKWGKVGSEERWPGIDGVKSLQLKDGQDRTGMRLDQVAVKYRLMDVVYTVFMTWHLYVYEPVSPDMWCQLLRCYFWYLQWLLSQQREDKYHQCWWLYHMSKGDFRNEQLFPPQRFYCFACELNISWM